MFLVFKVMYGGLRYGGGFKIWAMISVPILNIKIYFIIILVVTNIGEDFGKENSLSVRIISTNFSNLMDIAIGYVIFFTFSALD